MTTPPNPPAPPQPSVERRVEFTVEVPGTPQQVWDAIATANGISAWMIPTDLDEREGGAVCFHMGPEVSSEGTVTGWEPPRRLEYSEPDWAGVMGRTDADFTPLVSEFLVEARSGGTCVVRVVSSAFGVGADWEEEFFADMARNWIPMFDHLRLYLAHFPGQQVTSLEVAAEVPGTTDAAWSALRQSLGVDPQGDTGQIVEALGVTGVVDLLGDERLVVRTSDPVPGLLAFSVWPTDGSPAGARVMLTGYVYGADAPGYVEREKPAWQAWAEGLGAPER
jgi:uncharacterized protein YndB with AHSA1/START domain